MLCICPGIGNRWWKSEAAGCGCHFRPTNGRRSNGVAAASRRFCFERCSLGYSDPAPESGRMPLLLQRMKFDLRIRTWRDIRV